MMNISSIMIMAARQNVVCRDRLIAGKLKLWIATVGAKRGFLVDPEDAPSFIEHAANGRLHTVATANGLSPVK